MDGYYRAVLVPERHQERVERFVAELEAGEDVRSARERDRN
jgi:hypothetical protein